MLGFRPVRIRRRLTRLFMSRRERELREMYLSLQEVTSATDMGTVLTGVAARAAAAFAAKDGVIMIRRGDDLRTYSSMKTKMEPVANAIDARQLTKVRDLPHLLFRKEPCHRDVDANRRGERRRRAQRLNHAEK